MKHCDILIIDHDYDDVTFLEWELYKRGMGNVHYVYAATDALNYLEDVYPDCVPKVIITEVLLSDMTVAEFMKHLQATERYKHIKVVLLSSANRQHCGNKFKELEHLDFFEKPNDVNGYDAIIEGIKRKMQV